MSTTWMITGNTLTAYLQACKTANVNNFKRDPRLTVIFEHATPKAGALYLGHIVKQTPELLSHKFTNDQLGNPQVYEYHTLKGMSKYSPTTLQYIAVLSNLIKQVGSLDGLRIVEIGGGYGGQCKTIMDVFKPACYHIIDLPEVCKLQRKYCAAKCFSKPTGQSYDLVISNYALSEIPNNAMYVDQILRKCGSGYITCNTDFVTLDFPHDKVPDIVGEREGNYILRW